MVFVTSRRLFVSTPSSRSMKFCECSGVAMRKISFSGILATMKSAAA
jgi:hypothetical protein